MIEIETTGEYESNFYIFEKTPDKWNPYRIRQTLYSIFDTIEEIYEQRDFQLIDNRHVLLAYMSKTGDQSFDWQSANLVNQYTVMA